MEQFKPCPTNIANILIKLIRADLNKQNIAYLSASSGSLKNPRFGKFFELLVHPRISQIYMDSYFSADIMASKLINARTVKRR